MAQSAPGERREHRGTSGVRAGRAAAARDGAAAAVGGWLAQAGGGALLPASCTNFQSPFGLLRQIVRYFP